MNYNLTDNQKCFCENLVNNFGDELCEKMREGGYSIYNNEMLEKIRDNVNRLIDDIIEVNYGKILMMTEDH